MFNNQIYGLTKGQYSPTSEEGKKTKSSPFGSVEMPFNPMSVALGAEASFVARSIDMDRDLTAHVLEEASKHKGSAFIEIYQNCNVFNDHAFEQLTSKEGRVANRINLVHGEKDGEDNQTVAYGRLTTLLVKAIQELSQEKADREQEITLLENRIEQIEQRLI